MSQERKPGRPQPEGAQTHFFSDNHDSPRSDAGVEEALASTDAWRRAAVMGAFTDDQRARAPAVRAEAERRLRRLCAACHLETRARVLGWPGSRITNKLEREVLARAGGRRGHTCVRQGTGAA